MTSCSISFQHYCKQFIFPWREQYYVLFKMLQICISSQKDRSNVPFSLLPICQGVLVFEIWTKRGDVKKLLRNSGLVERGVLLERGVSKLSSVFLQKNMFSLLLDFFCLANVPTSCNQQIYSFMWFYFYWKMIYYEISFPLTLIFNYNFVEISLLMTLI